MRVPNVRIYAGKSKQTGRFKKKTLGVPKERPIFAADEGGTVFHSGSGS